MPKKKRVKLLTLPEVMKALGIRARETIDKRIALAQARGDLPSALPTMISPRTRRPCRGFTPAQVEVLRVGPGGYPR